MQKQNLLHTTVLLKTWSGCEVFFYCNLFYLHHNHCAASCRWAASGHITSSTLQAILSLARHRGKNALEWRIHLWKFSTGMSTHASSIGLRRFSSVWLSVINLPSPRWEELLYRVQERGVGWQTDIYCSLMRSQMRLFSRTISTMRVSCAAVNMATLTPLCGILSTLKKEACCQLTCFTIQ